MNEIILRDLKSAFGIVASDAVPVSGGYLNRKWRVHTGQGMLLVKQYSHERFSPRKLNEIEQALQRQILLHGRGVPCPRVLTCGGQIIRRPDENTSYMVMEFSEGHVETPQTSTLAQLESLGEGCARMHRAFSELPSIGVKGYPLRPSSVMDTLRAHLTAAPAGDSEAYEKTLARLIQIADRLPDDFADCFARSICHEDFSGDNMLFLSDRLSVFLDFDRNQYSFPLHDVGRALFSLTLKENSMDTGKVAAFLRGYNVHLPLTAREAADALRLTLCIEAPWWIHPGCFQTESAKPRRFAHEIGWVAEHFFHLDDLLH